jgi:hypothetical protein
MIRLALQSTSLLEAYQEVGSKLSPIAAENHAKS